MQNAALDIDLYLDITKAAEGKAEEVIVRLIDIVAVESGEVAVAHLDDRVGSQILLGDFDIILCRNSLDGLTKTHHIAVWHLGQLEPSCISARQGTLGQEHFNIRIVANMFEGLLFLHATDKQHARYEEAVYLPFGAVRIDVEHLFAWNIDIPRGRFRVFRQEIDARVRVLLVC